MKCRVIGLLISIAVVTLGPASGGQARADAPGQMGYQGFLRDSSAQPVSGPVSFQFSIYPDSSGGLACWGPENHENVDVVDGLFDLVLGTTMPLTPNCFNGSVPWLETLVNGQVMHPRKPLTSVPYAFASPSPQGLGAFVAKSFETVYHADTDGFVTGFTTQLSQNYTYSVYEDAGNPPSTRIQYGYTVYVSGGYLSYAISFPVKKGYYWKVANSSGQGGTLYFFPSGY